MSERTGLGVLEVAALRAVGSLSGADPAFVQSAEVLRALEAEGFGPAYLYPVLQDLAVPWKRHLLLLEVEGNFGSPGNDPAADARYTEVRLSAVGRLALRSEDGAVGPVPLGLVDGTAYCGGRVPPFAPAKVADALESLVTRGDGALTTAELDTLIGRPTVPTGAVIEGDLPGLLRGGAVTMTMSCRIVASTADGRAQLEITGFPLGVNVDQMVASIFDRVRWPEQRRGGGEGIVADVQDHTSGRAGVRIVIVLHDGVETAMAQDWLRTIWPVSIDVDWCVPGSMSARLRSAAAAIRTDPSGLRALRSLLELEAD